MDVFPSFWRLEGRTIVVIGGGEAAARKLRLLARTAADIRIHALTPPIQEVADLVATGRATLTRAPVSAGDIPDNTAFAIVATDDDDEAHAAVTILRAARIPVNAVDRTALCDFIIPSIVDRNPVVIGIATGGAAPILARTIRETLEAILPARLGVLAAFSQRFRSAVAATLTDGKQRKAFWERFFDGPIARRVLAGDETGASEAMLTALNGREAQRPLKGQVTVIELDPAAPDLLSLRALRILQRADLVLHDAAFDQETLELVRRDADRVATRSGSEALHLANDAAAGGLAIAILARPGQIAPCDHEILRHGSMADIAAPRALTA